MDAQLTFAGGSVIGNRYQENYDVLRIEPQRGLAVVADGMGSGAGSALAGSTAVSVLVEQLTDRPTPAGLRAAVATVQRTVCERGSSIGGLVGCTLTALVADGDSAWIVHLGDSRVYRWRGRMLELLTVDHTAAWLGAIYGWYSAGSSQAESARYTLHRFVGHSGEPEPDVLNVSLLPGDRYLLCTDGVAEQIDYNRLGQLLSSTATPQEIVDAVLDATLRAGGRDNATAALVQVTSS